MGTATNRGRLLFKNGFTSFGLILDSVMHKNSSIEADLQTVLRVIDTQLSKKLPRISRTKPKLSAAMVFPRTSEHGPLVIMTTPTYSYLLMCAATISFTA